MDACDCKQLLKEDWPTIQTLGAKIQKVINERNFNSVGMDITSHIHTACIPPGATLGEIKIATPNRGTLQRANLFSAACGCKVGASWMHAYGELQCGKFLHTPVIVWCGPYISRAWVYVCA